MTVADLTQGPNLHRKPVTPTKYRWIPPPPNLWEETSPESLTISLNGKTVARDLHSGLKGEWQRLGPWITESRDGTIEITSRGGAANFSGIELWKNTRD